MVCVVSDHGLINNDYDIKPNVLLYENKLIEIDENNKGNKLGSLVSDVLVELDK